MLQELSMREKNIKRLVVKQLKKDFPKWRRLPKKEKRSLAKQALGDVMGSHPPTGVMSVGLNELTNTPAPPPGIIPLNEMKQFVEETSRCSLLFPCERWERSLNDPELRAIDALIDDHVVNRLLAPEGFTPSKRAVFPCHYLRAELLKSLCYAEFSYRKFCGKVISKWDRKEERAFLHLPKGVFIDHTQMSRFRTGLRIDQMINLMVYAVHLLIKNGKIAHPFQVCGVDSSELAACCSPVPLATVKIGNKKVRIYSDLDADCGKRRKKRDKSEYFVGYRLHTLVAIDPRNGHNYPLFSLVAPGNHHDNLFLPQLLGFAQAMGLSIEVITADEGYGDAEQNGDLGKEYGVTVITPASEKVTTPDDVDPQTHAVYMNGWCEIPMSYAGRTDGGHEFKCGADAQECFYAPICAQCREIPVDAGLFGQIPDQVEGVEQIRLLRKHMERVYNLLKHREGLEPLRVRSQHAVMAVSTFANVAMVLLEIVGTRKTTKEEAEPEQLRFAANG
jgi:hypothetical protein